MHHGFAAGLEFAPSGASSEELDRFERIRALAFHGLQPAESRRMLFTNPVLFKSYGGQRVIRF